MVIDELQKKHGYEEFCLWGRSMGAVSSILALDKLQSSGRGDIVKCAVFDAPFTKARTMVQFLMLIFILKILDLMKTQSKIPTTLIKGALIPLRSTIRKNIG